MKKKIKNTSLDGPVLDKAIFNLDTKYNCHPFTLPIIKQLQAIEFPTQVTFFVGENGSGKSTILEAIAYKAGFGAEGGSKNIQFKTSDEKTYNGTELLSECIKLSWREKPKNGYFFRAESFFNVANYLSTLGHDAFKAYGGKSLHEQSHGESFLSFFNNRLGNNGFFIFDEPEAALSPERQLSLISIIYQVCKNPRSQFIIATHSPILLAYSNATIYSCDRPNLPRISYTNTQPYQITKTFLDNPDLYLQHLLTE